MHQQQWQGKTVWITGASSGIGKALALSFAQLGANVVLSARRDDVLQQVEAECLRSIEQQILSLDKSTTQSAILVLPLDVTDESAMPTAVAKVMERFNRIDLLINNAGISQRSRALDTDLATYRTLFDVDVIGQIALTQCVLPVMLKQGAGHIAVTSSVAGKMGVPFRSGYCAAKHAVIGYFDTLRAELAHQNIDVSVILPGYINTDIGVNAVVGDGSKFNRDDHDNASGMSAEQCADVIVVALGKKKAEIPVGKGVEMHALWIKRFFPRLLNKILQKQYLKRAKAMSE